MGKSTEKRIIAFTPQSLRQCGIRVVCMDDIVRNMNISRQIIHQIYTTKDNLINICRWTYQSRIENTFHIIGYDSSDILEYLRAVSRAYIKNLYKAVCALQLDVSRHLEYRCTYNLYNRVRSDELKRAFSAHPKERRITPDLEVRMLVGSFTALFYSTRVTECLPTVLHDSATFMLRGIMMESGIGLFDNTFWKDQIIG